MDQKEKMKELIKKKQGGGRSKQMETPKNDRKNMRKGPKILISNMVKKGWGTMILMIVPHPFTI